LDDHYWLARRFVDEGWSIKAIHLMRVGHERLIDRDAGRDFRLTDVAGDVLRRILA
jgi:hypothetical protein